MKIYEWILGLDDELCSWNSPRAATLHSKWFVFRENKSVFIVVNGVNNRINRNNHSHHCTTVYTRTAPAPVVAETLVKITIIQIELGMTPLLSRKEDYEVGRDNQRCKHLGIVSFVYFFFWNQNVSCYTVKLKLDNENAPFHLKLNILIWIKSEDFQRQDCNNCEKLLKFFFAPNKTKLSLLGAVAPLDPDVTLSLSEVTSKIWAIVYLNKSPQVSFSISLPKSRNVILCISSLGKDSLKKNEM